MAENRKPVPKIGVDMLYVAPVIRDDETGVIYGEPIRLPGLNSIGYDPSTKSATYDADDGTYESFVADGVTSVSIRVADLLSEHYVLLLGLKQDEVGVIYEGTEDNPPEMALGWRSQKSDGSYRFVWVLKGKFGKSSESYATKSGSGISYNDMELSYTALNRICDGLKRRQVDSNEPKLDGKISLAALSGSETGWFSSPDFCPGADGECPVHGIVHEI